MSKSKDKKEGESSISKLSNIVLIIPRYIAGRARVITALVGIILILFATTLPAISFVFDNPNEEGSTEIMWDGDLIRAETGCILGMCTRHIYRYGQRLLFGELICRQVKV